jgi:hypothetical protein
LPPAIPRFVSSFREGEGAGLRLYLAQEHVEGSSLEKLLETKRSPDLRGSASSS